MVLTSFVFVLVNAISAFGLSETKRANTLLDLSGLGGRKRLMVLTSFVFVLVNAISQLGLSQQMSAARSLTLIFLRTHCLLVDTKNCHLIEADTFSGIACYVSTVTPTNLALVEPSSNKLRKLLNEFPDLLKPTFSTARLNTVYITSSQLKAKKEFLRWKRLALLGNQAARGHLLSIWYPNQTVACAHATTTEN